LFEKALSSSAARRLVSRVLSAITGESAAAEPMPVPSEEKAKVVEPP
jgi:hypothetical protein